MPLPAGLPYRTLLGVWYCRKAIQQQVIYAWVSSVSSLLTRAKDAVNV